MTVNRHTKSKKGTNLYEQRRSDFAVKFFVFRDFPFTFFFRFVLFEFLEIKLIEKHFLCF